MERLAIKDCANAEEQILAKVTYLDHTVMLPIAFVNALSFQTHVTFKKLVMEASANAALG